MRVINKIMSFILLVLAMSCKLSAATVIIPMYLTNDAGVGKFIGDITAADTQYGLLLTPSLVGLPPGEHGFHVHQNDSCMHSGMDAGGHLDPKNTGKHLGPYNKNGHLGDLPVLVVNANGTATIPVLAPRLTTKQIHEHALMIHAGGDNYADSPKPLGGGGTRIACGLVP